MQLASALPTAKARDAQATSPSIVFLSSNDEVTTMRMNNYL
jgi:hypothetical protein